MSDEEQQKTLEEKHKEIKVTTTEEVKRGVFANQAIIQHSNEEFRIDFILMGPSDATLNARIILTPSHFKRLVKAMDVNLKKYEKKFGEVPEKIVDVRTVN